MCNVEFQEIFINSLFQAIFPSLQHLCNMEGNEVLGPEVKVAPLFDKKWNSPIYSLSVIPPVFHFRLNADKRQSTG